MARWEPNARERLRQAALALYAERGYAGTTVEAIAARAGLSERTFFRHYADKREVLFGGAALLEARMAEAVAAAPAGAGPLALVAAALAAVAAAVPADRATARARQAIIQAEAELRERDVAKMAALDAALAAALRARGVGEPAATVAAGAGIAAFRAAWAAWLAGEQRPLEAEIAAALAALRGAVAGP